MFTGIIEGLGVIRSVAPLDQGLCLGIQAQFPLQKTKVGDSIAVNGCCLTVIRRKGTTFFADLSHETLNVTSLKKAAKGMLVNLERPLSLQDRLGGHLVLGHVDGLGKIRSLKRVGANWEVTISYPQRFQGLMIPKGSVAVDGISMTVNSLTKTSFRLVVIPHTWKATNLHMKQPGDPVNLEVDIIGKYIQRLMPQTRRSPFYVR